MENLQNINHQLKLKTGRWTRAEHNKFMQALEKHGRNWILVQRKVKTRSLLQIRSHAQKVFLNMFEKDIDALIGHEDSQVSFKNEAKQKKIKIPKNRALNSPLFHEESNLRPRESKTTKETTKGLDKQGHSEEKSKLNGIQQPERKNSLNEDGNLATNTEQTTRRPTEGMEMNQAQFFTQQRLFPFFWAPYFFYPALN